MKNCNDGSIAKAMKTHRVAFVNQYSDYWRHRIEKSSKLSHFYYTFKNSVSAEKYLTSIQDPKHRQTLSKLRLGDHKLAVEALRLARPKIAYADRKCALCHMEVENEVHFLFKCSWLGYRDIRKDFEARVTEAVKNFDILGAEDKAIFLMVQEDTEITDLLAIYVTNMFSIRAAALSG